MSDKPSDLVQGTLDMLILKTLALEPMQNTLALHFPPAITINAHNKRVSIDAPHFHGKHALG
jgi:hypothetical protein